MSYIDTTLNICIWTGIDRAKRVDLYMYVLVVGIQFLSSSQPHHGVPWT